MHAADPLGRGPLIPAVCAGHAKKLVGWKSRLQYKSRTIRSEYKKARRRVEVSVGDSLRIVRELQELSQNDLSELTSLPQSTLSAIENNRVTTDVTPSKCPGRHASQNSSISPGTDTRVAFSIPNG